MGRRAKQVVFTSDEINLLIGITANANPDTYIRDGAKAVIHKCKDVMALDDVTIAVRR